MNNRPSDTPSVRETPSQSRGQVVDDSRYKPKGGIISTNEFPCTHTCLDLPSGEGTGSSPIGTNPYGTQHDIVGLNRTCIPLHALSRESNSINRYKRTAYVNDQQTPTKVGKPKLEAYIQVNGRGVCTPPPQLTHGVGAEAGENPSPPRLAHSASVDVSDEQPPRLALASEKVGLPITNKSDTDYGASGNRMTPLTPTERRSEFKEGITHAPHRNRHRKQAGS